MIGEHLWCGSAPPVSSAGLSPMTMPNGGPIVIKASAIDIDSVHSFEECLICSRRWETEVTSPFHAPRNEWGATFASAKILEEAESKTAGLLDRWQQVFGFF